jgi:hypothetical protein
VQVGKHIELGRDWFVEPQVGLQMARVSGGHYTASNGLKVEQNAMLSVQSRVGGGVMVSTVQGHNMFVEGGYTQGNDIEQPWALTAGYRYQW